jgi:hypothetical protein
MAVTLVDVPLPLFEALGCHLAGFHFSEVPIEFEQHYLSRSGNTPAEEA